MAQVSNWRTLHEEVVFSGGPIREIAVEAVQLPNGRVVPDYHVIRLADYVLVYAEMADGSVPMIRQYKHGPRRVCLTFPGGAIDDAETPLAAAQRELREETGCESTEWESLGTFVTNANQGCNRVHLFRATGCHRTLEPLSGDLEEMSLVYMTPPLLAQRNTIDEIGLVSHVMLLLLARHLDASGAPAVP